MIGFLVRSVNCVTNVSLRNCSLYPWWSSHHPESKTSKV